MRHLEKGRKFGRIKGRRRSFVSGLVSNLIQHGRISTTEARAKEIKPKVEKLVTVAKKQDLSAMRSLLSKLPKKSAFKMYNEIAPKYADRKGGYTRIVKTAVIRKRDAARKAIVEFV
ncbi:MAG: 50S ribosomal protein L17 [Patescibacteria group bacterium]|nr:50S ribosomal protein L17 [Patescibacteria group bacterium]MDE2144643.1 50S ribosomal protein L17 [Patescibacteria group bacterium]